MKFTKSWLAAAAMVALTGAAQGALVSLGDGTVKDTDTNLIWLQNWNLNGLAADWNTQKAWAEGLDFAGSTDWVLPEISEYRALFRSYGDVMNSSLPFTNVQADYYWSGTERTAGVSAWLWNADFSTQTSILQDFRSYAVAVRPGDVTASVPEPQTLALVLLALAATVVARRRRSR